MSCRLGVVISLVLLVAATSVWAVPNPIAIEEPGTNLFAGKRVEYAVRLRIPADFKGRLAWAFSAANGQILPRGRGEMAVSGKAVEPVIAKIVIETPSVKDGVVLETKLELTLFGNAQRKPEATLTRKVYIYPLNPFVDRADWLRGLGLVVFDANDQSKTIEALEGLKIPHERVKDFGKLADQKAGVIIIGAGVSFKDERGLVEALVQLAQRGCKVICLSAEEGSFALPGSGAKENAQDRLAFLGNKAIRQLDKRLDPSNWSSQGPLVSHSFHLTAEDGKVNVEVQANAKGWSWLEAEYANGGRLVFCQFALMRHWDSSPTPRYLFARILESVTASQENQEPK